LHLIAALWNQDWKILIFHVLHWRKRKGRKVLPLLPHHPPKKVYKKTPFLELKIRAM
ncbi:hypothetical protein KI387_036283, partial [Taxus chinensis]